jgi:hypothetical protein
MQEARGTFRIFVSSTFVGLEDERDALQLDVFPALAKTCEALGAGFQAVDLRWGVRQEAALNQQTMEICTAEIDRCLKSGIKPNFILLLGDRYGWQPLPARIDAMEFELVRGRILSDSDRVLVDHWYERDENAVPPQYVLRPRTAEYADPEDWSRSETQIHTALRQAAVRALLSPEALVKYETSATHQEILRGLGSTPADREHVFAFFRSQGNAAEDFELSKLKSDLGKLLGPNIVEFKNGDMTDLITKVRRKLEPVITEQAGQFRSRLTSRSEADLHEKFASDSVRLFRGRGSALKTIEQYLLGATRSPLVIHGESGSGKSALMAAAFRQTATSVPNQSVVTRFIGSTTSSSGGVSLLRSICLEIAERNGHPQVFSLDFSELVSAFHKELLTVPSGKKLILFVDGLNQLQPQDPALTQPWIPAELLPNCRVVVSAIDVPPHLGSAQLLELGAFPLPDAEETLSFWLRDAGRTLQPLQRQKILTKFARCPLPLHLKLAFEEARHWTSFRRNEDCALGDSLDEMIDIALGRLSDEANHGRVLTGQTLRYFSAARRGLTEEELVKVLNTDKKVWDDFLQHASHRLSQRILPAGIWSRLFYDLRPYLSEHTELGVDSLAFLHGRVRDRIAAKYLDAESSAETHQSLATCFQQLADPGNTGEWKGNAVHAATELPFHLSNSNDHKALEELLNSLPYLRARVQAGGTYLLSGDYELVQNPAGVASWKDFIRLHAQKLVEDPNMLLALVNHEGFPSARAQVVARNWPQQWLKTSLEPVQRTSDSSAALRVEMESSREFPHGREGALAPQAQVIFSFERLGSVAMFDALNMRQLVTRVNIRKERPLKFACSPDASCLLVVFESSQAELYRGVKGQDDFPSNFSRVVQFSCFLPEFDEPVVEWFNDSFWLQIQPGMLGRVDSVTGKCESVRLPEKAHGELAALLFLRREERFIAMRQGNATMIVGPGDGQIYRVNSSLCAACTCGDEVAAAFSNGFATIFRFTPALTPAEKTKTGVISGAVGWDGERLLWLADSGNFPKLRAWRFEDGQSEEVQDSQKLFPSGLQVIPRVWIPESKGRVLLLTTHSMARFHLSAGGSLTDEMVVWLDGGATWRAVTRKDRAQWLLEAQSDRKACLGTDIPGRLYCGVDGRGYFYAARVDRPGAVWNLADLYSTPLLSPPQLFNAAAGDPEAGCWFCDRRGGIFYVGDDRIVRQVETVKDGLGANLLVCGDYLLWWGTIPHYYPEYGVEQAREFVFFRRRVHQSSRLERLGERRFSVREGLCINLAYNHITGRLTLLWQPETKRPLLRTASIEDFLNGRFHDRDLKGAGLAGHAKTAFSGDGKVLGIVNSGGVFHCVDIENGIVTATLAGSFQFTHLAPAGDDTAFWLVQADQSIYRCTLVWPL